MFDCFGFILFIPLATEQIKARDFYTPALMLMKKRKQEMMQELEDIKKKHAKKSESAGTQFSFM